MKRRIAVLAAVFALAVGMLGGCGNNAQPAADSTKAEENSVVTSISFKNALGILATRVRF